MIRLPSGLSTQLSEELIEDLKRRRLLDHFSIRRLSHCPLVSVSLNNYANTSDKLLNTLIDTHYWSISELNLAGCSLLTDASISNVKS
jgi:hypothetical protein